MYRNSRGLFIEGFKALPKAHAKDANGKLIPVDPTEPNPNGIEFDNLYLDMNGIIHPCTHPEDKPAPKDEDEMMTAIFEAIDRLLNIVRPRKLLYMAVDGVAPRAKMNQQRSRRFRASKETAEKNAEIENIRARLEAEGAILPPPKDEGSHFDSNCITPLLLTIMLPSTRLSLCWKLIVSMCSIPITRPDWVTSRSQMISEDSSIVATSMLAYVLHLGTYCPNQDTPGVEVVIKGTPFMARLSQCLHFYAHNTLNKNPAWKHLKIILSDANVPGEGEHKIMDFIRKQRAQPDHDPNTVHCLCGADADLIMLGLATHEAHFYIIREEFKPNAEKPCDVCGVLGHEMKECTGLEPCQEVTKVFGSEVQFIFVRLMVLREYLKRELDIPGLPFPYDFERALDDWVFMCFFVGNDFLPHLPSLEIREGAIDRLVKLYKTVIYKTEGYVTDSGDVALERVQMIMHDLGVMEDGIFKNRQENEERFKARSKARKSQQLRQAQRPPARPLMLSGEFAPSPISSSANASENSTLINPRQAIYEQRMYGQAQAGISTQQYSSAPLQPVPDDSEDKPHDEVRLWEDGFKDRYYESKFDVNPEDVAFRHKLAVDYVLGLCWVLKYYYQGCPSWKWYFPYHYAPFASDFVKIAEHPVVFEKGTKPFNPLEQLMGVFPAASGKHIPEAWVTLMTDPKSTIIDFYPEDFEIDLNGKKFAWQGVALLPFVDEDRLFAALAPLYPKLTDDEKARNVRGDDRLYISDASTSFTFIRALYENAIASDVETSMLMDGIQCLVLLAVDCVESGGSLISPVRGFRTIRNNIVLCVRYRDPKYEEAHVFKACRLLGAIDPPPVLKPLGMSDEDSSSWKPQIGMNRDNRHASLGRAGHRMLGHYTQRRGNEPRQYAAIGHTYDGNDYGNRSKGNRYNRGNDTYRYQHPNERQSYQGYHRNDRNDYAPPFQQFTHSPRSSGQTEPYGYSTSFERHVAHVPETLPGTRPRYSSPPRYPYPGSGSSRYSGPQQSRPYHRR